MRSLADLLTVSRLFISMGIMALGLRKNAKTLPTAVLLALLGWITDTFDGPIARLARPGPTTRIGKHDFTIDTFMVLAMLSYLTTTGVVAWQIALAYVVAAVVAICSLREQAVALAFMAPVDGLFLYTGLRGAPTETRWALLYLACLLVFDWSRFWSLANVFVGGMRRVLHV